MPPRRICLFTGSFNPPGLHHEAAARALAAAFDEVRVIPCGFRPDKPSNNVIPTVLRAALADLAFRNMDRVTVEHFDMERENFTSTVDLEKMFAPLGEVWHTVWANKLKDGKTGRSLIQT